MIVQKMQIIDSFGLHARPASLITAISSKFKSNIFITSLETKKNADIKSLMNLMSLGLKKDDFFEIKCEGIDEEKAYKEITKNLKNLKIAKIV